MVIGAILRPLIFRAGRQVYRALNIQDDLVKQAWMTSPTRNIVGRGGVLGARHGAAGGLISSAFITDLDDDDNNGLPTFVQPPKTRRQYQKSGRKFGRTSRGRGFRKCPPKYYRRNSLGRRG